MKKLIILISALFALNSLAACPDSDLEKRGFEIESENFFKNAKKVITWLEKDQSNFVDDVETRFFSTQYNGYVLFNSYDHLATDTMEMFGDAIIIRDLNSFEVIEVRWYENGQKKISYNAEVQSCASNLVPIADNALY
jgi:hypothetical protein